MYPMHVDDLFESDITGGQRIFRHDWVAELRARPLAGVADIVVAVPLARLVHDDLEGYGTDGRTELTATGIRTAISALRATVDRLGIQGFDPPFRDFDTFRSHWKKVGASGSGGWQARRDILSELFDPLHDQLDAIQAAALQATLAMPVTSRTQTGWPLVDQEVRELRRHFQNAKTIQEYSDVGNRCVRLIEAVSAVAYDPADHLRPGETEPPVQKTKMRLDRVVEDALPGPDNAPFRQLARAAVEAAQSVKHSHTPDRTEAGIVADAAILAANIFRRLREP